MLMLVLVLACMASPVSLPPPFEKSGKPIGALTERPKISKWPVSGCGFLVLFVLLVLGRVMVVRWWVGSGIGSRRMAIAAGVESAGGMFSQGRERLRLGFFSQSSHPRSEPATKCLKSPTQPVFSGQKNDQARDKKAKQRKEIRVHGQQTFMGIGIWYLVVDGVGGDGGGGCSRRQRTKERRKRTTKTTTRARQDEDPGPDCLAVLPGPAPTAAAA